MFKITKQSDGRINIFLFGMKIASFCIHDNMYTKIIENIDHMLTHLNDIKSLIMEITYVKEQISKLLLKQSFFEKYILFKQRFGIEIPAESCGVGVNFELIKIKLKDLKITFDGVTLLNITDSPQYHSLVNNDSDVYFKEQILPQYESGFMSGTESLTWSWERYKDLVKQMDKEGYCPEKSCICIRKNNTIIDGWHRAAILYNKYGPDHEIVVVKVS